MGLRAEDVTLQLAETAARPFSDPQWLFELKLDGFRVLAERVAGQVRLFLRRGRTCTRQFPEISEAVAQLPPGDLLLDGELVIQDAQGHPVFQRLLKRGTLERAEDIARAAREHPAAYFAFDVLACGEDDVRAWPLHRRKELLFQKVPRGERILPLDHLEGQGEALLAEVKARGLEGVVAKRRDAPYRGGRGPAWQKFVLTREADFAVVGYAQDWGALYLAAYDGARHVYAGKVGSGFTPAVAESVKALLEASRVTAPCFDGEHPGDADAVWVTPSLVAQVRYKSWPRGLSLREPVWRRFRPDKDVTEVERVPAVEGRPAATSPRVARREVALTNLDKPFFPEDGLTKGDLVAYYRAVAPWLLPYLRDRPILLTRYPDGIHGKSFFQKALPLKAPSFVRTVKSYSSEANAEVDQIVLDDVDSLVWAANLGTIPIHIPAARVASPGRADHSLIDFDPKQAPFAHVVTLALALKALCDEAGLPVGVKTTGSSGLHALIPLGGQLDHDQSRDLASALCTLLARRHPALATVERTVQKRGNRVYLDAFQNGRGKVMACALCVRPLPGAPVSMPLTWDEVGPALTPRQFTIRNAVDRLARMGDPLLPVLGSSPDLPAALERLSRVT